MEQNDNKLILQGLCIIETTLNKQMTEKQVEIYIKLLEDIPGEKIVAGIKRMLKERVYTNIPAPAEIRLYCLEYKEEDLIVRIAEGKKKLKDAISSVGIYATVAFDDPVLHLIIRDMGGWQKVGMMDNKEFENYLKFNFDKLYAAYATRQDNNIPTKFIGISNLEEVTYIGEEQKAKNWIEKYTKKYKEKVIEEKENMRKIGLTRLGDVV